MTVLWIAITVVALLIGVVIGWKARKAKDELDRDIDRIFYEALKQFESY